MPASTLFSNTALQVDVDVMAIMTTLMSSTHLNIWHNCQRAYRSASTFLVLSGGNRLGK